MTRRNLTILLATLGVAVLLTAGVAAPARGAFGFNELDAAFEGTGAQPATLAGSHQFRQTTTIGFDTEPSVFSFEVPSQNLKDLRVVLPPGFVADTTVVPRCSMVSFVAHLGLGASCAPQSQIGITTVQIAADPSEPGIVVEAPVYNLDPAPGMVARFGFVAAEVPVTLEVRLGESFPYQGVVTAENTPEALPIYRSVTTVWGVPADPVHNPERAGCEAGCADGPSTLGPPKPFLTLPTSCREAVRTRFSATSWQAPAAAPVSGESAHALALTGCDGLEFTPTITNDTSESSGETPTGLDFHLDFDNPGLTEPAGRSQSAIEKAVVTLPEGVTTNPSIVSGLGVCTLRQYESEAVETAAGVGCPQNSKVGSVEIQSPLISQTIFGSIYVAKQGDNPFHNLLTIYMVARESQLGIIVKAAGRVEPNPATGQLTTVFEELPQLPFSHFKLHLRGGPRAPLVTPPTCGSFTTGALLYPYSNPSVPLHRTASFDVSAGAGGTNCAGNKNRLPNSPGFLAGTESSQAGAFSPFVFHLSRADGSQQFSAISTKLPLGLIGKLAGIPYCPESGIAQASSRGGEGQGALEQSAPSCPQSSEVGTVTVASGAGPYPYYVQGHVYLAGPYRGAPLSLEIVTPAVAGPFDLGVVAVRTALQIDPETAQINAVSDPIPSILHGLPLMVRSIALNMSRPDFTLNPTNCEPAAITGSATSTLGSVSLLSQYFQASDCRALGFHPKLRLTLKGKTKRSGHPALKAVVTFPHRLREANTRSIQVGLPHSLFLDQGNLDKVCKQADLHAGTCPKGSIYGRVKAWTPLLAEPLQGPVYLGVGFGYKLPALVVDLNGQIRILSHGRVDTTKHEGLRNTFEFIPDAPVSRIVLEMKGGKKYGLIENSENLCRKKQRVSAMFNAQNGLRLHLRPKIRSDCGKKRKHTSKKHGRGGSRPR